MKKREAEKKIKLKKMNVFRVLTLYLAEIIVLRVIDFILSVQ